MKALTLREPWASAIAYGTKRAENRTWRPRSLRLGDRFAIHAGKKLEKDAVEWLREAGLFTFDRERWEPGCVIATAELVGLVYACEPFDLHHDPALDLNDVEHYRWMVDDHMAWILDNVELVDPTPATGRLFLWDWDP